MPVWLICTSVSVRLLLVAPSMFIAGVVITPITDKLLLTVSLVAYICVRCAVVAVTVLEVMVVADADADDKVDTESAVPEMFVAARLLMLAATATTFDVIMV